MSAKAKVKTTSFRLGEDTLKKLAALAEAARVSRRAILENLIRKA